MGEARRGGSRAGVGIRAQARGRGVEERRVCAVKTVVDERAAAPRLLKGTSNAGCLEVAQPRVGAVAFAARRCYT